MLAEDNRKKIIDKIPEMRMIDDTFMSAVFDGQKEETALLLRIVLGKSDIEVMAVKAQVFFSNVYGREVRLDIVARDQSGKAYNVEVQRSSGDSSPQRARFTGAMVDIRLLDRGQDFTELPDRYTIFITEKDKFHKGCPSYHAANTIEELDNEPLGDGSHIVYINGEYRNVDTPIGQLMHDFFCANPEDMLNPLLRERVSYLKETEGGREEVCKIVEDLITEEKIEMAKAAIAEGDLTLEQIAKTLRLPLPFVQELAKQKTA